MKEIDRKKRNADMLMQCYPPFGVKIAAVLRDLEGHGWRPRIQQTYRTEAEQLAAYHNGYSSIKFGFHNVVRGGHPAAMAADILDDNAPLQPSTRYLLMLAACAKAHRLQTGIEWGLPVWRRLLIRAAIAARRWGANVRTGWDPTHCEVTGITPSQAKAGKNPA